MSSQDFQKKALSKLNVTSFINAPGPMRTGLCWWHSKLQRSALYLAVFDKPNEPKPSREQALRILENIAQKKFVVSIPGFNNWNEFTSHFYTEVEFYLGRWEMTDTVQLEFLKGAKFNKGTSFKKLKEIEREVNEFKRIAYTLVDLPGWSAHSWLIAEIDKNQGYYMKVIDSNAHPGVLNYWLLENRYDFYSPFYDEQFTQKVGPDSTRALLLNDSDLLTTRYYRNIDYSGGGPYGSLMSLSLQNESDYSDYATAIFWHCRGETPFTQNEKEVKSYKRKEWLKKQLHF